MFGQVSLPESCCADLMGQPYKHSTEVHPLLAYARQAIVNVVFWGAAKCGDRQWVLVDTGLRSLTHCIEEAAEERFGRNARPRAIVLTHGHFDHVGGVGYLSEKWQVPVYAHEAETKYLNGQAAYPAPDTSAGGGVMPTLSILFPRTPVNISEWLSPLPHSGDIPGMEGWKWISTPGHSPGHISLWHKKARTLISGDACITTNQESVYAVLTQSMEMHGPPKYFTTNWAKAEDSVKKLATLEPEILIPGHGRAAKGKLMRKALQNLAASFSKTAVPNSQKNSL